MNVRDIGRPLLWFVIGLAVAATALFLLHRSQQNGFVVRSYSVAPEIAGELKGALREALPPGIGNVSQTPDGHIVVSAPESVQQGVKDLIADVAAKKPAPTPTIHFEVWLVSAVAAAGVPDDDEPRLAELRPALAEIQKAKGPLRFELIENLALQARAGNEDSGVRGAWAALEVAPTIRYDAKGEPVIAARVNVRLVPRAGENPYTPSSLKALAELRPGQLLVIGQNTIQVKNSAARDLQIYYIVRASL